MFRQISRFVKARFISNRKPSPGIVGSIEKIEGNKVIFSRLGRQIELTVSGNRTTFKNYNDWKFLQEKKGHYGTFRALWDITRAKQQKAWDYVGIKKTDHVLDVGFRDGFNLKELGKRCSSITGIEVNKDAISHAKQLGCTVLDADIQNKTPLEESSFDVIILCDVLEHCFQPENVLTECRRLLKPNGRMIIEIPFEDTFYENLLHGHSSLFQNDEVFKGILSSCGFSIIKRDLSNSSKNLYVVCVN